MVAKELLNSAEACVLVICPLTSIIQDQIAEAKALGITCVSLPDLEEVKQNTIQLLFSSAERTMEKDFRNFILKDHSSLVFVIDRLDRNPPITAREHDVEKVRRSHQWL